MVLSRPRGEEEGMHKRSTFADFLPLNTFILHSSKVQVRVGCPEGVDVGACRRIILDSFTLPLKESP